MANIRVLISEATSYKAVVVATFLKSIYREIDIVTCDYRPLSKIFHTRFSDRHIILSHSLDEPPQYVAEIQQIIENNNIKFFFPVHSREMNIFMENKEKLPQALSYLGTRQSYNILNKKDFLYDVCEEIGIKTPRRFKDISDVIFPAVVKPTLSSSAQGVYYFYNKEQLDKANLDLAKNVVQEYIKGEGVGYSVFAKEGGIKQGYGHRRIAEYPLMGGSSIYRESFHDERMVLVAERLLRKTQWSGFAMFEFKLTEDNQLYLIEVNPRIWGSMNQGLQNGVNYFENILGEEAGRKETEAVYTYFSPFIYYAFILYGLKGNFRPLIKFLRNLTNNRADIGLFRDPLGWTGSFLRLP